MPWSRSLKAAPILAGRTSSRSCARKPRSRNRPRKRSRCNCALRTCTLRSSRIRPRPSSASRRFWRLIRPTRMPSAYLKQMYEKRRDWERLIAVLRQEVGRIADPAEQARRWAEVAKLATEKLKKAAVSIELWSKVLESERGDAEALAELEKLYEREKHWEELAAILQKQVALTSDPAKRGALLPKLAILYTEKLQKLDLAIAAWKSLLESRAGQSARPGCLAQAVPAKQGLGRSRRVLFGAEQVGRIRPRAGKTGGVRGRCHSRRPVEQDRDALPGPSGQARQGAEGVREDPVARFGKSDCRRGTDPHLRESQGCRQAGGRVAGAACCTRPSPRFARSACSESRKSWTTKLDRSPRLSPWPCRPPPRIRRGVGA